MLFSLFGCQQSNRSEKPLRSTPIGRFMPSGEQRSLFVVESSPDKFSLFVKDSSGEHEIGRLTQQLPNVPAKTIFAEIEGVLFVVAVVDAELSDATTVSILRTQSGAADDTMNTMRAGDVKNSVSFIPIGNQDIAQWHSIAAFQIFTKQRDHEFVIDFAQPIMVDFVAYPPQ
ncbi:MAG: hypothetical protein GWP17_05935 [Aquificales bacterium]|nr:hypothetical protein [Aquificales bacterium]